MTDPVYEIRGKRVWVAGQRGMVGSALMRRLGTEDCELLPTPRERIDLRRQEEVERWLEQSRPQLVFMSAARVGGIHANNTRPAEFIYDNLMIEANIVAAAHRFGIEKLVMLGSSCIYPKMAPQPIPEEALLTGPLESTNQWYAIAKIAGIKLCQAYRQQYDCDFISAMPTNLYGPGDNFDLESSHVVPALIAKAHRAKLDGTPSLEIWGTGTPRRELLYVDDAADALVHLARYYSGDDHLNIGTGDDVTIRELAEQVCQAVGYEGHFSFDSTKPDGTPRKLLNVDKMRALGWTASTTLADGLTRTYRWYREHHAHD